MRGAGWQGQARLALSVLYGMAGIAHLIWPEPFTAIVPAVVPWPETVVWLTGLAELAGAVALHVPRLRRAAGLMLALYALAVWPANLTHALSGTQIGFLPTGWWYHGPRLAFQPVLIWLALFAGGWVSRSAWQGMRTKATIRVSSENSSTAQRSIRRPSS